MTRGSQRGSVMPNLASASDTLASAATANARRRSASIRRVARVWRDLRLSALRPRVPVIAVTNRDDLARKLIPYWGVLPVRMDIGDDVAAAGPWSGHPGRIGHELLDRALIVSGAPVVLVSINADLSRTDANYLKIHQL